MSNSNKYTSSRVISALLTVLALVLFGMQYTTVYKLAALKASVSYITLEKFSNALAEQQIGLDSLDILWLFILACTTASLLFMEWRGGHLTAYWNSALSTHHRAIGFFFACSLVLVRYYFAPGNPSWAGDASQHISYTEITRQILAQGELPIWTNALGAGSPYLQFYGFLFFYFSAAVSIVVGDLYTGLKITLALCHILSGFGVYALVCSKTHSRKAGFFAGLVYILSFWHMQHILILGRLPLSLFYALLPWPFYFFERALKSAPIYNTLGASIALGLLAFTHPGYGFWATVFFAIYAILHIATDHFSPKRCAIIAGCILFIGLIAGGYLTLGMWLEKENTGLREGFNLGAPSPTWWHIFVWSNYRFWLLPPTETFHWYGGYLGNSAVATAIIGVGCSLCWKLKSTVKVWLPFLVCILLICAHNIYPFNSIAIIQAFPPSRYLLFIVFFLSIAAGLGYHFTAIWSRKTGKRQMPTLILLILLFDLVPTTFQHVYPPEDTVEAMLDVWVDLASEVLGDTPILPTHTEQIPNYRLLYVSGDEHSYLAINRPLVSNQIPNPRTVHPGDLLSGKEFTNPFERLANDIYTRKTSGNDLSPAESRFLLTGLRMLNVGVLISTLHGKKLFGARVSSTNPILTSNRLVPYPSDNNRRILEKSEIYKEFAPFFRAVPANDTTAFNSVIWIIENTELDAQLSTCTQIFARNLDAARQFLNQADVHLLNHNVYHSRVDIQLVASGPTFVRLAYSYSPHLSIRLNGKEVEPYETAGHFIALSIPEGQHHIELVAELSPLRRLLLGTHVLLWLSTAWAWLRERRRR